MRNIEITKETRERLQATLAKSQWFKALTPAVLDQVVSAAAAIHFDPDEVIVKQGDPADCFYLLVSGLIAVQSQRGEETVELGRIRPPASVGEMGLLLNEPRSATIVAIEPTSALKFTSTAFAAMLEKVPGFSLSALRGMAARLQHVSTLVPLPEAETADEGPSPEVLSLLPMTFIQRFRVLPLKVEGSTLTLGCVDDPTTQLVTGARQALPGMELKLVRILPKVFDAALHSRAAVEGWSSSGKAPPAPGAAAASGPGRSPRLDRLLERVASEGASDLHLCAGQRPHWRVDGEIHLLEDLPALAENEVFELLQPAMDDKTEAEFKAKGDADFAYALPGLARFRVNIFRDMQGVGAVLRQIPSKIVSFEQLGLPPALKGFCELPKGLVLVTGATGSGKSTTLAAMIDYINRTQKKHIVTLEEPIEFVHASQQSLVNQRQIGVHSTDFARALRAALREDPNIVLVGEMRDLETVSLTLELASTGHLVFATLHTSSAVATVDRIVDMFPHEQQAKVRATLADSLKGVVSQTLLKKNGGGRIAAFEVLVVNFAVANLVRESRSAQIFSSMQSGKAAGNQILNDELQKLVERRRVDYEEAYAKAVDKLDLAKRLRPGTLPLNA